jgi:hypothetical protein
VDGYSFDEHEETDFEHWKSFALDRQIETWFSATLHRERLQLDKKGIPAPVNLFTELFSVIIMLHPMQQHIELRLLKDHDNPNIDNLTLKLDPRTLLIANHQD